MNNKISKIQLGMLLTLICSSLYLGISDIILLKKSGSETLIAMILGTILGIIPVLMYLKVNSCLPNLNIYEKNKKLFGKKIGFILNILLIIIYMFMLLVSIRSMVIFITSKYMQNTPYIFVGALIIITSLIICFNGIETIARVSQLSFFASILFMVIIEIFLLKYISVQNVLPIINNNYMSILNGAIYHASSCALLIMLLLTVKGSFVNDEKNYNKTIIIFYLISSLSLCLVMFFVIACFGYEFASSFRYPEYILLKKIGLSGSELHLENLLAFRWIFYMLALCNISLYGIICGVESLCKNKKRNNFIVTLIAIACMILGKYILGNITHSIIIIKDYFVLLIAVPMFLILTILFIRSFFIKKES